MPTIDERSSFDDLVEGRFHAVLLRTTSGKELVKLYRLEDSVSGEIAAFTSEEAFCALLGGFPTVDEFNKAMDKRRVEFATVTGQVAA